MRSVNTIVVTACLLAAACTDAPTEGESEHGVTASNKIILNKIVLNKIVLNKIVLNKIVLNSISTNHLALNSESTHDLLNGDENDVTLLAYLIGCAFPDGVTLTGTDDHGVVHNFPGQVGLAPKWSTRHLMLKETRWISACILARVNKVGAAVLISLRGPHDALTVTTEERNEYVLEEGAYFGDIFDNEQRFYACRGADLYSGNFGGMDELRACAQPTEAGDTTLCGMTYAGECDAFNVERACESTTGEYYERCHTSPSKHGRWNNESICNRFEEAITVWVKPL